MTMVKLSPTMCIFTQEDLSNIPSFPDAYKGTPMNDYQVSEGGKKLCNLDVNKSTGPA